MGQTSHTTDFFTGVIEGFYGKPWAHSERLELFDWMSAWGLNTYVYAPKDDLKHRAIWRELYSQSEADALSDLIRACQKRDVRFCYALSPGLDLQYGLEADLEHLRRRFEQMMKMGCDTFALLFDDIPDRLSPEVTARWGSLASAQSHVANACFHWVRRHRPHAPFLFCPTAYCGRMADRHLGGPGYLSIVGRELAPEVDVFWTGPEIISREISTQHAEEMRTVLRRKPLIWDNLFANDYDGRRFFCGPYSGRPPELRAGVRGLFLNPNCEFPLNYVPIQTLAHFVTSDQPWDARGAYLSAMREWLPRFETVRGPADLDDLILLGDCYYLPYEDGPEAEALYLSARKLLAGDSPDWATEAAAFHRTALRLKQFCTQLTEVRDRRLFYALSRRIWDLREELDLLDGYVQHRSAAHTAMIAFRSDFHLPGTFRGGMLSRLQNLLEQQPDGTFQPARPKSAAMATPHTVPSLT